MRKDYKFFVADDSAEFRNIIIYEIIELGFSEDSITECQSESEALQILTEYADKGIYFDFLFVDIDFSEGKNSGTRKSGFKIIEHAFNLCPFSLIATYSAQYNKYDLLAEHNEYLRRGWIVRVFDKSFRRDLPQSWFKASFAELLKEREETDFFWDIWYNHRAIELYLKNTKLLHTPFDDLKLKQGLIFELRDISARLKLHFINKSVTDLRIVVELYHKCIETFCCHNKTKQEIIDISKINFADAIKLFKRYFHSVSDSDFKLGPKIDTVLRRVVALPPDDKIAFGIKFNSIRNGIVHKGWTTSIENAIFSNLTLALFILPAKSSINLDRINTLFQDKSNPGGDELIKLIEFIKK
ncbi:MAG: hypothetical protein HUU54_11060 [Ignavibacteriaceae bacterium]|nr:hypothetical protein [Ignavibacteriaceae bacterium]